MKIRVFLLLLLVFTVTFSPILFAAPYADKPEITSRTSDMGKLLIRQTKVPDISEIGIPPYPDAKAYQAKDASEMVANGKKIIMLPYIKLLSTDPAETVVAWYKDHLEGYTYEDVFGASWVFWKGDKQYNGLDIRLLSTIENVAISAAIKEMDYDADMKGTQSVIDIYYEPK